MLSATPSQHALRGEPATGQPALGLRVSQTHPNGRKLLELKEIAGSPVGVPKPNHFDQSRGAFGALGFANTSATRCRGIFEQYDSRHPSACSPRTSLRTPLVRVQGRQEAR